MKKDSSQRFKTVEASLCCPQCRGRLFLSSGYYICDKDGAFKIDENGRPHLIKEEIFFDNEKEHQTGVNRLKSFLKRWPKLYYSIWHLFCPVLMLQNGPRMIAKFIPENVTIIDIGSGPERLGDRFLNIDVYPFPEVDIVADAESLPFGDDSIDAIVSESMLEHVPHPLRVTHEMLRVLKKGGVIYVSAPFIHPYHASPDDFNRWTLSGLKELFPNIEIMKSGVRSGPWSAFLMFLAYWLGIVFSFGSKKTAPFLAHIFMLILGPFKYLDFIFMNIPGAEAVAAHLYIIGRKK
ncbi:MAG TPA: class I SAM-dependent methyltransferase [Candidatus Paceibacterota bacterium]